ncbi:MAG: ADP-glyceromanno-heptose 6-epimerase [Candidatus Binatus sp.]|uniref:ADP-glyceromanno-heptose 6-epimerase n=1 Tax=Candidatus Binatus sp. TaxID=2811406 RepID=UPI0027158A88|nr:ADP-glyceromanno-heptose 6-epimerase [Candidatus Binatus sp.]MDO8432292.1 ADP-glyceromanno-heptose 6-epimerase [Candidatus Binatus sp.]
MIVVTGGAGFIGSNLIESLNQDGIFDVMVVDRLGENFRNLCDLTFADFMPPDDFIRAIEVNRGALPEKIDAIFHQGACADTTCDDGAYMMENNFTFSKAVLHFALSRKIPFVYASSAAVYGASNNFAPSRENERPLNLYALSKLAFDNHVRAIIDTIQTTVVGLRYFNVYGPREAHKHKMASMPYQLYRQLKQTGRARLFKGADGYRDGDQRRDFVFVGDVVRVNRALASGPPLRGIFNVGTGKARAFNDVANLLIRQIGAGAIDYVPFPESLAGRYQSFTEADLTGLRNAGYDAAFTNLEDGIASSVAAWNRED